MATNNPAARWGAANKLMHWVLALVVVLAFIAVWRAHSFEKGAPEIGYWMMLHKSFGVTALALMVLWRLMRVSTGRPAPYGAKWQVQLSQITHWGMIILVLAMPLAGLLMSQVGGRPVSVFGLFEIPVFMDKNKDLAGMIHSIHTKVAAPILLVLILAHVGGALWHHIIDKDETLKRMLPGDK